MEVNGEQRVQSEPRPKFVFPHIHDNPIGWGPCAVPEQFKDTPYQPFSKDDRLGKVRVHVVATHLCLASYNTAVRFKALI